MSTFTPEIQSLMEGRDPDFSLDPLAYDERPDAAAEGTAFLEEPQLRMRLTTTSVLPENPHWETNKNICRPLDYNPTDEDLWLRGETRAMVEWAKRVQKKSDGNPKKQYGSNPRMGIKMDHSRDEDWVRDYRCSMWVTDKWVLICTWLHILVKCIYVIPLMLLHMPFLLLVKCYSCSLNMPTEYLNRNNCCLQALFVFGFILNIPAFLLILVSYIHDLLMYYICNLLYVILFRWLFFCDWCGWCRQYRRSQIAIAPFRAGPGIFWSDIVVVSVGHTSRLGFWVYLFRYSLMWTLLPTAKYFVNTNPWTYDLSVRFMQQISTSMQDMRPEQVQIAFQRIICRVKQEAVLVEHQSRWKFLPCYPFPTSSREDTRSPRHWHLGMQVNDFMCLFVHTTHAMVLDMEHHPNPEKRLSLTGTHFEGHPEDAHPNCLTDDKMFVLSNSGHTPIVRVVVWYNNPFHLLTGFVEAEISHGGGYQMNKFMGGEHPMWVVTSRSPLVSQHSSAKWTEYCFGSGEIDAFFDRWLPHFVRELRLLTRGEEAAEELMEEVQSREGTSRAMNAKRVPHFSELEEDVAELVRTRTSEVVVPLETAKSWGKTSVEQRYSQRKWESGSLKQKGSKNYGTILEGNEEEV